MSYNRKIFYMSLYEGNEKKNNTGFVKVIEKRDVWEVQVHLSGVPSIFDGEGLLEVTEGQARVVTETVPLNNGSTDMRYEWEKKGELSGLSFWLRLSENCVLSSGSRGREEKKTAIVEVQEEVAAVQTDHWLGQEILWTEPEGMVLPDVEEVQEELAAQSKNVENPSEEKVENRKWKQIWKVYPHIKPFEDFREYIKLELKDMVLLSEKRYSLVENSFLLHGYYNYGHIILWRKEKAPVKYYIGVPGNFYDKEKQVAVLYGFESFEGAVEPAKEGDFGYYMTEVML